MTPHAPKVAALMAYQANALSAPGRARVERHLGGCLPCREALGSVEVYDRLIAEVRSLEVPEVAWARIERGIAASKAYDHLCEDVRSVEPPTIDFSRMELALRREARAEAKSLRPVRTGLPLWPVFALAAATVLGVVAVRWLHPPVDEVASHPPVIAPARAHVTGWITALGGAATATANSGRAKPLDVGSAIEEGMQVANQGEAHIRFADGTGVAVRGSSAVKLSELRDGQVVLNLERGGIANAVHKLAENDHYRVQAGPWTVEVRGTRFSVTRQGDEIAVTCDEGAVRVSRNGQTMAMVTAPSAWSSSPALSADPIGSVVMPYSLGRLAEATLTLPSLDWVKGWQIGGTRFGPEGLRMRVPTGEVAVVAFNAEGREFRTVLSVPVEGASINERSLGRPRSLPVVASRGELDPSLIAPVVRSGIRRMQRCQELIVARGGDAIVGRFSLQVIVARTGRVQSARLEATNGPAAPESFTRCVRSEAESWMFPPPSGGSVTFEQPLTFGTRAH